MEQFQEVGVPFQTGLVSFFFFFFKYCFTSTETKRTVRDGEPRTATSTLTQLLSSDDCFIFFKCCYMSTETSRTIKDG